MNGAYGGAALSTSGLMVALRAAGIESCAVCHDAGSADDKAMLRDAAGGEVLFLPLYISNRKIRADIWKRPLLEAWQSFRTGRARLSALRVASFAARHQVSLIHTNTILNPEGGLAARWLGLPHVWHLRELLGPGAPFRLAREGTALGRYLARHCSVLVANSRTTAERVRAWLPPGLLDVVPNGIDLSRFVPRAWADRSATTPIVAAMVAHLDARWKKHALFLDAAARVDPALKVEFRIYGHDASAVSRRGDAYALALHDQARRLGLGERIKFFGTVPDPVRIMSEIDVLVHPADSESFGRVVVEAMAAALPVAGARGGGVAEIVEDGTTGLLARPDDPAELAAAIERLARDPGLRRAMGRAGRQRAEEHYSLQACAAGIVRVYDRALAHPLRLWRRPHFV